MFNFSSLHGLEAVLFNHCKIVRFKTWQEVLLHWKVRCSFNVKRPTVRESTMPNLL